MTSKTTCICRAYCGEASNLSISFTRLSGDASAGNSRVWLALGIEPAKSKWTRRKNDASLDVLAAGSLNSGCAEIRASICTCRGSVAGSEHGWTATMLLTIPKNRKTRKRVIDVPNVAGRYRRERDARAAA